MDQTQKVFMESEKKKKKHRKLRSKGEAVKNKRDSPGHSVAPGVDYKWKCLKFRVEAWLKVRNSKPDCFIQILI